MATPTASLPIGGKHGDDDARARNRSHQHFVDTFTGNGVRTRFPLSHTPRDTSQVAVYVSGLRKTPKLYAAANDFSLETSVLVFTAAPALNAPILVEMAI